MFSKKTQKSELSLDDFNLMIEVLENYTPRRSGFFASGLIKAMTTEAKSEDEFRRELNDLQQKHKEEERAEKERITVLMAKVIQVRNNNFS